MHTTVVGTSTRYCTRYDVHTSTCCCCTRSTSKIMIGKQGSPTSTWTSVKKWDLPFDTSRDFAEVQILFFLLVSSIETNKHSGSFRIVCTMLPWQTRESFSHQCTVSKYTYSIAVLMQTHFQIFWRYCDAWCHNLKAEVETASGKPQWQAKQRPSFLPTTMRLYLMPRCPVLRLSAWSS